MDRMNPLDASFLYLENGITHMHIGSCAVFEGPPPPTTTSCELFAGKLPLVPRYRQRVRFVPMNLGRPVWVDDPDFNLEYHVRHTALPAPGSDGGPAPADGPAHVSGARPQPAAVGDLGRRGPRGDRWALISKIHHCMVDGVAGVDLISLVLDHDRRPSPPIADDWDPEEEPSSLRLAADALVNLVTSPREQLRAAAPRCVPRGERCDVVATSRLGCGRTDRCCVPLPRRRSMAAIGPHRRWTFADARLDDVRIIRHELGGTVNDVIAGRDHERLPRLDPRPRRRPGRSLAAHAHTGVGQRRSPRTASTTTGCSADLLRPTSAPR